MTAVHRRRGFALVAGGAVAALLLAACGGGSDSGDTASPTDGGSTPSPTGEVPAGCEAYAAYLGNEGSSVTLFTSILPPEQQLFEQSWAKFEECTGIDIVYEASDQFEAQLPTRIAGGNAPDIAFIPQPGLLATLVERGGPVPAPAGTVANVDQYWNPAWKSYGTVDGTFYAAPLGSNMKSFVWYSPKVFADNGYTVPETWDDMFALSDQMVSDGITPWCGGLESGGATGWPATDWLEQVMLRLYGGEVYDQWVNHELVFNSPEVTEAMNVVAGWMKNEEYVNGGHVTGQGYGNVASLATIGFQDAGVGVIPGTCGMLQQASFYANFWVNFDENATIAEDGDVFAFYLPAISDDVPTPIIGGGEFVTAFSDAPAVQAAQTFLASAEFATAKAALGTWVSANSGVPLDTYANPIDRLSAELLTDQTGTFRFDASDLMPAAVGAGAMWTQMTAWFAEDKPTEAVLQAIDDAWPSS